MPEPETLRAVVFDLDGLMFNTEELYQNVGRKILRRRGKECTQELLNEMMGRPGHVALGIMIDRHALSDTVEQLQRETTEIFFDLLDDGLAPMPGLLTLLQSLEREKFPKAIATSSRRDFTCNVLSRFDLEPRFEFLLTAEDVEQGKPHPEIYRAAAARLGLTTAEIMVLEDSQNGCRAAVAAGTFAVAIPAGQSRSHDFTGAALIADSLSDRRIYEALAIEPDTSPGP